MHVSMAATTDERNNDTDDRTPSTVQIGRDNKDENQQKNNEVLSLRSQTTLSNTKTHERMLPVYKCSEISISPKVTNKKRSGSNHRYVKMNLKCPRIPPSQHHDTIIIRCICPNPSTD